MTNLIKLRSPLYIVGYPRSGTTLLRALLGAHTQIHLVNEPELIRGMFSAGLCISDWIHPRSYPVRLQQLRRLGMCNRHLSTLSSAKFDELLMRTNGLSFRDFYELLLPKPDGTKVWGEKSLGNSFYLRQLYELYPNALFVHIVRDPKAVLLSYYRKKFARSPALDRDGIRFFALQTLRWNQWLNAVRRASGLLPDGVVMEVWYDDLVTQPERVLEQSCNAIGLKFEKGMLDPARRKNDPVLADSCGQSGYAHKHLSGPIDPQRAQAWRELPAWAGYIVEKYADDSRANHELQCNGQRLTILEKLRLEAELLRTERNVRAKLSSELIRRGPLGEQTPAGVN